MVVEQERWLLLAVLRREGLWEVSAECQWWRGAGRGGRRGIGRGPKSMVVRMSRCRPCPAMESRGSDSALFDVSARTLTMYLNTSLSLPMQAEWSSHTSLTLSRNK